ncbi:MAG TPA: phytoene/squalene synthase family protein [Halobacteriales archaeon]|nr:phytoene/squalene synthase family protein [Halobacteriales archaeon]
MTTEPRASSLPPDHDERSDGRSPDPPGAGRPNEPPTIDPEQLAASAAIQRRTGKTFYLATRFFPEAIRHATHVLYGFVRIADEVVDGSNDLDPAAQRRALRQLRAVALGREPTDHPVLDAFQTVREHYRIRDADVSAFLDSMEADVDGAGTRYATPAELDDYVYGSAAAVGHMMTTVMGVDDEAARPHAASLGAAFQLTNFLRDVREDVVELDRVYLPESVLARHGASHDDVERLAFDERVAAAVRDELVRAEERYRHGVAGIHYLPEGTRFPVLAAAVLYAEYHRVIREAGYDVLSARPSLGTTRKLRALARTGYHWLRTRDPEGAFYAASAVPQVADEPEAGHTGDDRHAARSAGSPFPGAPGGNRGD